jgi:hypothetical protein
MSLAALPSHRVATSRGVLELRGRADVRAPYRAIVIAIPGGSGGPDEFSGLPDALDIYGDGFVLPLEAAGRSPAELAEGVAELIAARFADRRVVLAGAGAGAAVCLAVRSPGVRRVVAIEPELAAALEGPGPLVDVLLGADSRVADEARLRFEADRRVRVQAVPESGLLAAPKPVVQAVQEACRRAMALRAYDDREVDEALLEASPLNAGRLAYWGPQGRAFCAAYGSRSPNTAAVTLTRGGDLPDGARPPPGAYDLVAVDAPASPQILAALAALLAPDGRLVCRAARIGSADTAAAGLVADAPVRETGAPILHLRRRDAAPPPERLYLYNLAFAPRLMDIRTRLPTQMLRSEPGLEVAYATAPTDLPVVEPSRPKVMVLQRPAERRPEIWRPFLVDAIVRDWITVMEFDDHPLAIADVLGHAPPENAMERFGYFHAVQTSTPSLVEAFGAYNPEVALFPNAVFELLPFPNRPPPRRVFYGGVLRGAFAVDVARSLAPVVEEFPDVEFVVIGDKAVFDALPTERKFGYGYMSYEAYLSAVARCAVSISPLEPRPLLETKSDAKYLDAARAGVPTIASPTVYEEVIVEGENGLIARAPEDWARLLAQVLREPELQRRLGRNAWEDVRAGRMFAGQVAARRDWYRSLWARRAELHEQLMDRVTGLRQAVDMRRRARP